MLNDDIIKHVLNVHCHFSSLMRFVFLFPVILGSIAVFGRRVSTLPAFVLFYTKFLILFLSCSSSLGTETKRIWPSMNFAMPHYCCVLMCSPNSQKNSGEKGLFHSLPKDRLKWQWI